MDEEVMKEETLGVTRTDILPVRIRLVSSILKNLAATRESLTSHFQVDRILVFLEMVLVRMLSAFSDHDRKTLNLFTPGSPGLVSL